jgi:alpha-L-rhamnosidase
MANAYLGYSARLLAKAEHLVGEPAMAEKYQSICDSVNAAIWSELAEAAMQTTTGCSILLEFEIAPQSERAAIADKLAAIVRADNGRISTGFLGTPEILDALSSNGKWQEAFLMLLREEPLSWLFPLKMGATTIWERWDAIAADGTISTGKMEDGDAADPDDHSMISFNHYAYGAVLDWIHRNVLGLELSSPGYQTVVVSPKPVTGIDSCKGWIETGYGTLAIDWQVAGDSTFTATLKVPFGVTASLELPASADSKITLNGQPIANGHLVTQGEYKIQMSAATVIRVRE